MNTSHDDIAACEMPTLPILAPDITKMQITSGCQGPQNLSSGVLMHIVSCLHFLERSCWSLILDSSNEDMQNVTMFKGYATKKRIFIYLELFSIALFVRLGENGEHIICTSYNMDRNDRVTTVPISLRMRTSSGEGLQCIIGNTLGKTLSTNFLAFSTLYTTCHLP